MSINLLELVKNQLSPSLIEKAAALLKESPEAIQSGLLGSSGALLSGLSSKLSDPSSASQIFDNLGSGDGLASIGQQLAGGNETVEFLSAGADKAKALLGDNTDKIMSAISSSSGLRPESASSLLGMAAPLVTGVLAKQKEAGMNLSAMTDLMSSQASSFSGMLPSGLDLPNLGGIASVASGVLGAAGELGQNAAGAVSNTAGAIGTAASDAAGAAVGKVGDLASGALSGAGDLGQAAAGAVGNVAEAAGDAASAAVGKAGDLASGAIGGVTDGVGAIANAAGGATGGIGRFIPWILAGLAALAAVFFLRSCSDGDSMTDAMNKAASSTTEMVKDAGNTISETASSAMDVAGDAAKATGDMAGKAMDSASNVAGEMADSAGNAAKATMDAAGTAGEMVKDVAVDAAKATGDVMESGVDKLAAMGKKIGDNFRFTLPGGANVDVPEGSFEAGLLRNFAEGNAEYGKSYILDRIYFATGSYNLTAESADQLKTIAAIMKAYPELTGNLSGHTDSTGSVDKNFALSVNRANAVKTYMTGLGIPENRLTSTGKGSAEPIADNGTPEGRAKNRRIDINFTK